MTRIRVIAATGCLILGVLMAWSWATHDRFRSTADRLILLVPDGTSFSNPKVTMWLDAGSEEGLHVVPVHDSEFLRPLWGESKCAGVILPDSIHQQASDLFIATLHNFVGDGGKLIRPIALQIVGHRGAEQFGKERAGDIAPAPRQRRGCRADERLPGAIIRCVGKILDVHAPVPAGQRSPLR